MLIHLSSTHSAEYNNEILKRHLRAFSQVDHTGNLNSINGNQTWKRQPRIGNRGPCSPPNQKEREARMAVGFCHVRSHSSKIIGQCSKRKASQVCGSLWENAIDWSKTRQRHSLKGVVASLRVRWENRHQSRLSWFGAELDSGYCVPSLAERLESEKNSRPTSKCSNNISSTLCGFWGFHIAAHRCTPRPVY